MSARLHTTLDVWPERPEFRECVRVYRNETGESLGQVAVRLDMKESSLRNLLKDRQRPRPVPRRLELAEDLFNKPRGYFMGHAGGDAGVPPELAELLAQLDPTTRLAFRRIARVLTSKQLKPAQALNLADMAVSMLEFHTVDDEEDLDGSKREGLS